MHRTIQSFNPNNNRIDIAASGQTAYTYDGAGNLTHDATVHAFAYDAENKQTTYDGGASVSGGATYYYDGDGRRVKKVVGGSPLVTTVFVYNISGQLVAEYSDASPSGAVGISYLTSDTLGTPRVITGPNQEIRARHDYHPFGEEISTAYAGRTTDQGYVVDNVRQKFTLKERDIETGLDFFEARYYASTQGRFTSSDPLGGHTEDPQTLNRYTYVRNNPQRFTDPTGLDFYLTCEKTGATCQNGRVGTTDNKGNFTATVISNNKNGGLADQNGNSYTATVSGQGVSFTQAGSNQSAVGVFLNGTNATTIQGSGDLSGFTFNFTESNMDVNITAKGTFTFNGQAQEAEKALEKAGYTHHFGDKFNVLHPSSDTHFAADYRSPGEKDTGAGSGHFTVHEPATQLRIIGPAGGVIVRIPAKATVPTRGDVHLGEHNPYTGGLKQHFKEVVRSVW